MIISGYKRNGTNDKPYCLKEVTIACRIEELEKIILFLETVKKEHESVRGQAPSCHSHYRDWDKEWMPDSTDIIVATLFQTDEEIQNWLKEHDWNEE